ncbi:MAG: hypothetical protein LBJ69_00235 [Holosporales bacterium]|jgi:hypothetical protein|nr:hypothetical protein [Holosporales bacterium]
MCYRHSRGVWKWWSSREREDETPVVERDLVPARTLFQENRILKSKVETLEQRIGTLELLLGTPPVAASGTGDKAVKAQAPTGIFLFTHQQFLINGAMQLADSICGHAWLPAYIKTTVWQTIQQQLDEADGYTTIQQIRMRWRWQGLNANATTGQQCAYAISGTLQEGPKWLCAAHTQKTGGCSILGYPDNGEEAELLADDEDGTVSSTDSFATQISISESTYTKRLILGTVYALGISRPVITNTAAVDAYNATLMLRGTGLEAMEITPMVKQKLGIMKPIYQAVFDTIIEEYNQLAYVMYRRALNDTDIDGWIPPLT